MENHNHPPLQPPPTQIFGHDDLRDSSTGIFASVFPPPSTMTGNFSCVLCSKPIHYEALDSQVWSTVHGTSAKNVAKNTVNANTGVMNMERRSIFQERIEPCPLSSSIYYGGQEDMYIRSSIDLTSKSYTKFFINDDPKDDLQSATRGNWWQGSLYY